MKNGFTLVELLAVLLILAIISLIAIPQVLHLIEKSRISSLEISASEYVRAVETSLINEEINRNVPNGLYTIVDDGKAIELNGKKIQVETSGNRIESGKLLVENRKVVRIIKGKIKDYYARIENEDMKIYKEIKESMLLRGIDFNAKIKQLVGNDNATYGTADTIVKEIIFLPEGILPEGITKEELMSFESVSVSSDEEVKAYYDGKDTIYVYSENLIQTNTITHAMFKLFKGLTNIIFNLLDTSKATMMAGLYTGMFENCENLEKLDLTSFDTSNVKDMTCMFANCKNLKEIIFGENFDTSKVTSMRRMFQGCNNLETLDLSNFNTSSVTNMIEMFQYCTSLSEINFGENFVTSNETNTGTMFEGCSNLTHLDLRTFDLSNINVMSRMFSHCSNLKEILVSRDKCPLTDTDLGLKEGTLKYID